MLEGPAEDAAVGKYIERLAGFELVFELYEVLGLRGELVFPLLCLEVFDTANV